MIIDIVKIIFGILFSLFIPGYLVVKLFLNELRMLEKIVISVVFSIMIDGFIAIYLGYDKAQALKTGGLTFANIFRIEIYIFVILSIILLLKFIYKKKGNMFKKNLISKQNDQYHFKKH